MLKKISTIVCVIILFQVYNATELQAETPKKIIVFGAGYIGTVHGACLAKCGHKIIFIESDEDKVQTLNNKKSPIYEPELEQLIRIGVENGLIEAKSSLGEEIFDADIAFIAVPTPTTKEGISLLDYVENVLKLLEETTKTRKNPLIVAIRSTILPEAFRQLERKYIQPNTPMFLVVNPEFLRESTAIVDFFHPPFCIVGGENSVAVNTVLSLYKHFSQKCLAVSIETACLLKYACNAFHAMKVSFTNEMASICDSFGTSPIELMNIFSEDTLLNCSSAYLKPGFAFGGPCLTKDLQALVCFGNTLGSPLPLLSSIIPSNQYRFEKKINEIMFQRHQNLAILGMSFKKNSDDLRESPFVHLIERLNQEGVTLRIFDPDIQRSYITDSAWDSFSQRFGCLMPLIQKDLYSALDGCDGVVLCKDLLTEELIKQLQDSYIPIYDLDYFLQKKGAGL